MIDNIIRIARDTTALDDSGLQALCNNAESKESGLLDFQRDLAGALLASTECKTIINRLLEAADKTEIEAIVNAFCMDNNPHIPPVFLLSRAVIYRVEEELSSKETS